MFFCNVFIIVAVFFKKDCNYRNGCGIRLNDADLEHGLMKKKVVHMAFFPFLYSGITDLALGIIKMLICVCFRDLLEAAV